MLRTIAIMVLAVSLLLTSTLLLARDYPMRAEQVAPNVYAVLTPSRDLPNAENRGWNSNSAFVVTESGVLVFDTGSSTAIGAALKETIQEITNQPVRWIINSHAHGDHWLGNAAFGKSAEHIYASNAVIEQVRADGRTWVERFQRMTKGATGNSQILLPNTPIDQRTELILGGVKMVIVPSGNSHSPGDLMLWLPESRVLISGDVVYSDRMPSTYASNLRQWISQLTQLERMQPKVVIPGHGKVTDVSGIVRLRELFETLWRAVEQGYQAGKSDYEMLPQVSRALAGFREHYPGLDDKLKRDISHVYLQVEAAAF
jgi:glyoxylase-like metal-dependent hydrolase (beta-lactamase superfamily II)